ncbi:hypothetical protein GCM10022221_36260 [Actinocorallia aurea]
MITTSWRKSSYSAPSGDDCVELADLRAHVGIRDSKHPDAAPLKVTRHELGRLVSRIRTGDLA